MVQRKRSRGTKQTTNATGLSKKQMNRLKKEKRTRKSTASTSSDDTHGDAARTTGSGATSSDGTAATTAGSAEQKRQRESKAAKTAGAQPASMGGQRRHGNESTDSPMAPCALPDLLPEQWTGTPMQMHVSSADDAMHETGSMMMTASGSDTALAAHGHETMLDVPTDVMTTDVTMLPQSDETITRDDFAAMFAVISQLSEESQLEPSVIETVEG